MEENTVKAAASLGEVLDPGKIVLLISGIFVLWLINKLVRHLSQTLMEKIPSKRFTILQTATLFSFIWYIGGLYVLIAGVINPPKEMLLAMAGSAAVAIGIALKDVVASVIAGVILLFDRPFQVGDRVSFGDVYGQIMSIGLRSVRLQTLDDNQVTIPNARFITEVVSSGNAGALDMMVVMDFHLALDADLNLAQDLIFDAIVTSRFAYLKKPVKFVVCEVVVANRLAMQLKAKAYVLDINYEKDFQTDVVKRVNTLFVKNDVKRPLLIDSLAPA